MLISWVIEKRKYIVKFVDDMKLKIVKRVIDEFEIQSV